MSTTASTTNSYSSTATSATISYTVEFGGTEIFSKSILVDKLTSTVTESTTISAGNDVDSTTTLKVIVAISSSVSSTITNYFPASSRIHIEYSYEDNELSILVRNKYFVPEVSGETIYEYKGSISASRSSTPASTSTTIFGTSLASFSIIPKIAVFSGDFNEEVNFVISEKFNNLMEFGTISNINLRSTTNLPSFLYVGTSFAEFSVVPNLVSFFADIYGKSSLAFNELYNVDGKFFSNNSINFEEKKYSEEKFSAENSFEISELIPSVVGKFNGNNSLKLSQIGISYVGDFNGETSFNIDSIVEKVNISVLERIKLVLEEIYNLLGKFEENVSLTFNSSYNSVLSSLNSFTFSASATLNLQTIIEKINMNVLERVNFVLREFANSSFSIAEVTEKLKFISNEYTIVKLLEESNFKFTEFTSYTTQLIYEVLESINLESYISSGKFEFVETQALSFLGTTTIIGIFKELATSGFSLIAFSNAIKGYTLRATFPPFVSTTSFVSSWTNVIDMMGSILRSLGFPVTYYSDLKNIQVDTEYLMGAYVLVSAEPTLYWHNWANMYTFKLRLYDKNISLSFTKYDDAIQKQVMYKVIGNKLNDGGIVVGYNAISNIKPMVRERKIALIEYTLRVLVMY